MSTRGTWTWMLAVGALTSGCGPAQVADETSHVSKARQAVVLENGREYNGREYNGREYNGREYNGREYNGREYNGREYNGREYNGRELNGVSLNGASISGVAASAELDGSELLVTDAAGNISRGSAVVGALLQGELDDGGSITLRIDGVSGSSKFAGLYLYEVSVQTSNGFLSYCGEDAAGQPIRAMALAGRWNYGVGADGGSKIYDPNSFTFACEGFALSKCVDLGYRPWASSTLDAHHQACTRMIRADYCGDGTSFTIDGVLINVYDGIGVQADTEQWAIEAEWDVNGARCLSQMRIAAGAPTCGGTLSSIGCGAPENFATGTLLMTETDK